MKAKLGSSQKCPRCGLSNRSGTILPKGCMHCGGTGREDFKMKIVAVKEKSAGNESIGDMWLETKIFKESTPVIEIIKWSQNGRAESRNGGRLIITVPDSEDEI